MVELPPHAIKAAADCGAGELIYYERELLLITPLKSDAAVFAVGIGTFRIVPLLIKEVGFNEAATVVSIGSNWRFDVTFTEPPSDQIPDQPGVLVRAENGWYITALEGARRSFATIGIDVESTSLGFGPTAVFGDWRLVSTGRAYQKEIELFHRGATTP